MKPHHSEKWLGSLLPKLNSLVCTTKGSETSRRCLRSHLPNKPNSMRILLDVLCFRFHSRAHFAIWPWECRFQFFFAPQKGFLCRWSIAAIEISCLIQIRGLSVWVTGFISFFVFLRSVSWPFRLLLLRRGFIAQKHGACVMIRKSDDADFTRFLPRTITVTSVNVSSEKCKIKSKLRCSKFRTVHHQSTHQHQ